MSFENAKREIKEVKIKESRELYLSWKNLTDKDLIKLIPEIRKIKGLNALYLDFNKLRNIESLRELSNLTSLDLRNNDISDISPLKDLNKLKYLYLSNNRGLERKIGNVVENENNPQAVLKAYLDWQEANERETLTPLNEAKVILIGQGNVGKSSLRISLLEGKCQEKQKKTEGLEVIEWNLEIDGEPTNVNRISTNVSRISNQLFRKRHIKLNLWDFGGQEIYHTTHRYFFNSECLYILVTDYSGRVEWRTNRLGYWLTTIQMLAEKERSDEKPVVIIVGNKIDEESDYKLSSEKIIIEIDKAKEKYNNLDIAAFVPISCLEGRNIYQSNNLNEPSLVEVIKSQFEKIGIYRQIPQKYLAYKKKIKNSGRYFIRADELEQYCPEDTDLMRSIFHSTGTITAFCENKKIKNQTLKDLIVFDYQWITKGIYKILSANHLLETNHGIATKEEIRGLLDEEKYPTVEDIIEMMKEFYLCSSYFDYDSKGNQIEKFLFPKFLSNRNLSFVKAFKNNRSEDRIEYKYIYNFISDNIIAFFIIRARQRFTQSDFWKDGSLIYEDKAQAFVEADEELNEISIIVKGKNAKSLLNRIIEIFEEIHTLKFIPKPKKEFENLKKQKNSLQTQIKSLEKEISKLKEERKITNIMIDNKNQQVKADGSGIVHVGDKDTYHDVRVLIQNNKQTLDFQQLSSELERLIIVLHEKATTVEEGKAIVKAENAKEAAAENDEYKVVKYLKEGGKFVFDTAKEIGTKVVSNLIEKQITGS